MSGFGVDGKKLIDLSHDQNRVPIFGIEFERIEKLSPGMRPARRVHQLLSTDMIVCAVTVALEDAFEVAKKQLRPFPSAAKPKIKHHRSTRSAVLPEVSLMVFAPTIVHLYCHGRFIGLNVGAIQ